MIFITGDTHIPIDIHKLSTKSFPQQKEMTKSDHVIICGDFGGVWSGSGEDQYWQKWLDAKSFTTCFVDGNHENFGLLNSFKIEKWNGGSVHKIMPSVIHLMRGQIYNIDNIKFFTMGGASSHDKLFRNKGISWWQEELPSNKEYEETLKNLDFYNWEVDYVITHCISDYIQSQLANWYEHDKLTNFLETVRLDLKFKHWYFGHYHIDRQVDEKHTAIYNSIVRL